MFDFARMHALKSAFQLRLTSLLLDDKLTLQVWHLNDLLSIINVITKHPLVYRQFGSMLSCIDRMAHPGHLVPASRVGFDALNVGLSMGCVN